MLTISNEVQKATYTFTVDGKDMSVNGQFEKNNDNKLSHLDGQMMLNGEYKGNIYINTMDGKLRVNLNNVESACLNDVSYIAQELIKEFEIAE